MAKRHAKSASSPSESSVTIHDQKLHRGVGGELHQYAEDGGDVLTTSQGAPVADDQNSLRVGPRGPLVVDD
jgi:catalase